MSTTPKQSLKHSKKLYNDNDYVDYTIEANSCDKYVITGVLGRGKYSEVFLGRNKETDEKVVIKVLKPIKQLKINRELLMLCKVTGKKFIYANDKEREEIAAVEFPLHKNMVEFIDVTYDKQTKTYSLIFKHIEHYESYEFIRTMASYKDITFYCKEILEGIKFIHKNGIMHRDIKPGNFLIKKDGDQNKQLIILDFGLAEKYTEGNEYCVRVASKSYKAPELLLDVEKYDQSIDIWSFGAVLGEMITARNPFFSYKKSDNILMGIAKILGKNDLIKYMKDNDIQTDVNENVKLVINSDEIPSTRTSIDKLNCKPADTAEEISLKNELMKVLDMILRYDPEERPTAEQLLKLEIFS